MERLTFKVPQMDCSAEEQLVRMKLEGQPDIAHLAFDLPARTVMVTHSGNAPTIERLMGELKLGASLVERAEVDENEVVDASDDQQRRLLWIVLFINAGLFVLELTTGLIARSMGLVADSLDMLADALVYGLSLFAVGRAAIYKKRVARVSGYFQLALAAFGALEVVRRVLGTGEEPSFGLMIGISLIALAGNVAALLVLQRARSQEAHMRTSWIFTTNDVLVNLGVIAAGVLVYLTGSRLPDLVIGALVFALVASGALRILKLSR